MKRKNYTFSDTRSQIIMYKYKTSTETEIFYVPEKK